MRRTYASATHQFEPATCRQFAQVVGAGAVPSPMVIVQALPAAVGAVLADPVIDLRLHDVLHAEQSIQFHRPVVEDEIVRVETSATECDFGLRRAIRIDVAVEGLDARPLADLTTTLVDMRRPARSPCVPQRARDRALGEPVACRSFAVGSGLPRRYAISSGDTNPIHLDDRVAREAGLPGVVLHGLCVLSMAVSTAIDAVMRSDPGQLASVATRFSRIARPGEVLDVAVHADDGCGTHAVAVRSRGVAILKGCRVGRHAHA